jgi:hypothetical protein
MRLTNDDRLDAVAGAVAHFQRAMTFRVKIDQDYLKRLLEACQASEKPTFDIEDLKTAGFNREDPRFEFHMMILADQGLIEQDDGSPGLGLKKSADGFFALFVRLCNAMQPPS